MADTAYLWIEKKKWGGKKYEKKQRERLHCQMQGSRINVDWTAGGIEKSTLWLGLNFTLGPIVNCENDRLRKEIPVYKKFGCSDGH